MQLEQRIEAVNVLGELDLAQQRRGQRQLPINQAAVDTGIAGRRRAHRAEQRSRRHATRARVLGRVLGRINARPQAGPRALSRSLGGACCCCCCSCSLCCCCCCCCAARKQLLDAKDHARGALLALCRCRLVQLQIVELGRRVHRSRSSTILCSNWNSRAAFILACSLPCVLFRICYGLQCQNIGTLASSARIPSQPRSRADIATHFATISLARTSPTGRASLLPGVGPGPGPRPGPGPGCCAASATSCTLALKH